MLRVFLALLLSFSCSCCLAQAVDSAALVARHISVKHLHSLVYTLSAEQMEGRETGRYGQKLAAVYLADQMKKAGLTPGGDSLRYLQTFTSVLKNGTEIHSENVVGYIPGTDLAHEVVIVSAHYDHLGYKNGLVCAGADDNASGTAAVIALAAAFKEAKAAGVRPRRTILFLLMSGEEKGLLGSAHYVAHPCFPLKDCIADLNIDMVGRCDSIHRHDSSYVYIIGSDMMSTELHRVNEEANRRCCGLTLDYTYNSASDPNRFYYRSDHYNFARNGIPVIFYFNGMHKDYHKPGDTPDKINFDLLEKRSRLVLYTLWQLSNQDKRISVDR